MRPDDFDIHLVIESLQGTCGTIQGAIEDHYPDMTELDLTSEDHDMIDNEIFECDTCNWWCEISEMCSQTDDCGGDHCENCCTEIEEE